MTKPLYEPSEWGSLYHNLTVDEALGAGAAGPGKSLVLLCDPLQQIIAEHRRCEDKQDPYYHPWGMSEGKALHLRRTRPMLDETIDRAHRIFKSVDPGVDFTGAGGPGKPASTFIFSSGYKYQFSHCKDPGDWRQYMSNQFTWIGFDELVQFEFQQYENISGRCRSGDPVLRPMCKVRSMSNPMQTGEVETRVSVSDPNWVRKLFVDPAPEGKKLLRRRVVRRDGRVEHLTRIYLPATLYDNPDKEFVDDYERRLLGKSEYIRQALLYGNWYATAGSYFGEDWKSQLHTCRPFRIPDHWPRFRSLDWGFKTPGTVLWWAMDDDENLFCTREYNFRFKTDVEVAQEIKQIEKMDKLWDGNRSQLTGPADTQLWEERGDIGKTKADNMLALGVPWVKADKKSRMTNGIRLLNRIRDHHSGQTTPGVVFFDNCKMCIRTIPAVQTDKDNPECPADGGEDHWLDAAMYAAAYASFGKSGIPRRRKRDEWADDRKYESVLRSHRGRFGYGSF
jgi:phage terminase large subunit